MSFTKTYFLCPTSEFIHPPPTGPLHLGSIIRSASAPQFSLNNLNTVVPINDPKPPIIETNWKKTVSAKTGFGLGVYAQFLQAATGGIGIGPEVDGEKLHQTGSVFAFDTLTTMQFEPMSQYVDQALKAPSVQAWLREPKQRFSPIVTLFLVTGMKLVNGAKIKYTESTNNTFTANIGIDAVPLGLTIGPKGHWTSASDEETEFNRDSEFVFAFRVKRLRIGRKVKTEEYSRGAFLAHGESGKQDDDQEPVLVEDVDGSSIETARLVPDPTEDVEVYCIHN